MQQQNNITVSPENQGMRLDKYLVEIFPEQTRSQLKKMIKEGLVLINGKKATVHQFLKEADEISIIEKSVLSEEKESKEEINSDKSIKITEVKIILDDPNFLIIEKPAGLLVHPTEKNETDTLIDWLIERYPKLKKIGEDPQRPAIVHRLDKEVSGLMLIPKNQDAFDFYKKQFKLREITKKYIALTHGQIVKDEDDITFPIGRSKTTKGIFAARPLNQLDEQSKSAHTKIIAIKKYRKYTLLEVQILTGRTHQIRVHLLAYGHPIVGDKLYGKKSENKDPLDRIFLHANYLSFIDQEGNKREFISQLPKKLEQFLKAAKL